MRALALAALVAALGASPAPSAPQATPTTPQPYSTTSDASAQTKAAVAAGKQPPHGLPDIERVDWTNTHLKPGALFEAYVTTSPNVVAVTGQYKQYSFPFAKVGPNRFHLAYKVPWLPPFLIGKWPLDVVARTSDGVEQTRSYELNYGYF
jgi:hypothetical protein